jgi:hypothetical protein
MPDAGVRAHAGNLDGCTISIARRLRIRKPG